MRNGSFSFILSGFLFVFSWRRLSTLLRPGFGYDGLQCSVVGADILRMPGYRSIPSELHRAVAAVQAARKTFSVRAAALFASRSLPLLQSMLQHFASACQSYR